MITFYDVSQILSPTFQLSTSDCCCQSGHQLANHYHDFANTEVCVWMVKKFA